MPLRMHPREPMVRTAENDLRKAISDVVFRKYDGERLSPGEQLRVVNAACSDWIANEAKYTIREERHGDASKPGGLAPDVGPQDLVNEMLRVLEDWTEGNETVVGAFARLDAVFQKVRRTG